MGKVNIDAIIPREDFEVEENQTPGKKKETISIEDIKADSFFFINVRKINSGNIRIFFIRLFTI